MAATPENAIGAERLPQSAVRPARDTRLDVLRGLALITIFINHVPGQIFEYATTKNFGFSDAAEAFVLISGIAVGPGLWLRLQGRRATSTWRRRRSSAPSRSISPI